jgi:hypothetical protein
MQTQFLEIYRVEGVIVGTPIRGATTYQLRLEYDNCFNFPGTAACFFLVSRDDTIGRDEALDFATLIETGKTICHYIDLSQLGNTREVKHGSKAVTKTLEKVEDERTALLETKQLAMEELFR